MNMIWKTFNYHETLIVKNLWNAGKNVHSFVFSELEDGQTIYAFLIERIKRFVLSSLYQKKTLNQKSLWHSCFMAARNKQVLSEFKTLLSTLLQSWIINYAAK